MQVAKSFDQKVLSLFQRHSRPVLLGEFSLETGYSLSTVEKEFIRLEDVGAIRQLTLEEKKNRSLHKNVSAFVLVDHTLFTIEK
jgi:hypothetical protein